MLCVSTSNVSRCTMTFSRPGSCAALMEPKNVVPSSSSTSNVLSVVRVMTLGHSTYTVPIASVLNFILPR